jgi:hypothetical protein
MTAGLGVGVGFACSLAGRLPSVEAAGTPKTYPAFCEVLL